MAITQFANPKLLWLLSVLIPMIALYIYRMLRGGAAITISTVSTLEKAPKGMRYYMRHIPFALRCCAVTLLIIAIARPQNTARESSVTTEGIDLVLALDISASMLARDFQPNRLVAAKDVAANFIADRTNDRIGLVVFAGESLTLCPLTTDKTTLLTQLARAEIGLIEDGTAIGNGLATSVNRLRESTAKSKVIILLTDGVNNSGQIAPLTAAEIARTYGIRVYTIGVGSEGKAPYPARDIWGNIFYTQIEVEMDEEILKEISALTGGEYFRATDKNALAEIYERINAMEKSRIETNEFTVKTELGGRYMLWAFILLVAGFMVNKLWLRRIP